MGDTHRLSRTLNHRGLNSLALGDPVGAENDFHAALNLAYEGGFTPATLNALMGLATLEAQQVASEETLELVLYILQHPSSAQETKNLAARLQMELATKLPQSEIESTQQRVTSKNLDEVVRTFLI